MFFYLEVPVELSWPTFCQCAKFSWQPGRGVERIDDERPHGTHLFQLGHVLGWHASELAQTWPQHLQRLCRQCRPRLCEVLDSRICHFVQMIDQMLRALLLARREVALQCVGERRDVNRCG